MMAPQQELAMSMERFRPILVTLAETMLPPYVRAYVEAADVAQSTFMEAHRNARLLATLEEGQVFAWLRKTLKHNVLDAIKHLKTLKNDIRKTLRTSELEDSLNRLEQFFLAPDTSPSQVAQRNEQITLMMAAVNELPENQRMAIILKHLHGHSLKEVAEIIGLSESATAGLLHRGRVQLMRRMEKV